MLALGRLRGSYGFRSAHRRRFFWSIREWPQDATASAWQSHCAIFRGTIVQTPPVTKTPTLTARSLMGGTWMQHLAAVAIGTVLLALSTHVQVPLWPVRLSMQNFVLLAIGLPFVLAEAVKLTLAAAAAPYFRRGLR